MKYLILIFLFHTLSLWAGVVGISTHPLNDNARVLSAEMAGYMSQRHEMGAGIRYTQEVDRGKLLDLSIGGGQEARGFTANAGMDFEILREDVKQPRVSIKPYYQQQKFENSKTNFLGTAPTLRKGFSIEGNEFFPYLAVPMGMRIDSSSDEYKFYSSLTLGASMPFPGANNEMFLLSLEGNKNLGSSSDYLGCLISWVWR